MLEQYHKKTKQLKSLSLKDERRLIRLAKKGDLSAQQQLLLHHIGFFIFRIRTTLYPTAAKECGEDILQECLVWTAKKIRTYNLRYRNKKGIFQPVHLRSYMWKGVTGLMFQYVRKNRKRKV